jgi:1,4-alpha-glucan branching enzyme
MTDINSPTLPDNVIQDVAHGVHADPFAVLGMHTVNEVLIVRAFRPGVEKLVVVDKDQGTSYVMTRIAETGLYEVVLQGVQAPFSYSLESTSSDGGVLLYEDPYAFPDFLTDFDEYLLAEGTHLGMYEKLGAHLDVVSGYPGVRFAVWAPNAARVSVVGDFNSWDGRCHPMRFHHASGIWDLFIPGLKEAALYKYEIRTHQFDYTVAKSDPVGFYGEVRPQTASIVWDIDKYVWHDDEWLESRSKHDDLERPINVYEVHLGSWRRKENDRWLTYNELALELVPYVKDMGYTHIELLPIAEHPLDGSWGYQVTGYFATTSRFGTPDEFMAFVDACHQAGIGVILDWVPAHFPRDEHGLSYFDGTFLYEHADPRLGAHPDWGTLIFNYGRNEVCQFLVSNAMFWLDKYHIDGLRVDAVASMLYLDFSREEGQWIPNRYGGRENLEAINFIRYFNEQVHANYPDVLTIAEESTSYAGITHNVKNGGLGFDLKWNMGWMHDSLQYMSNDPIYRAFHHGTLTFSLLYAFSENFLLPFSHDEVVHLKKSMLDKMPGDLWRKFANWRALLAYQISHPGKKMLFMGGEFGQWREWTEERSLDWHLLEQEAKHGQLQHFVRELNRIYLNQSELFEDDYSWQGFTWLDLHDAQRSILSYARHSPKNGNTILIACNFTPVTRYEYRLGVAQPGVYEELLNSDSEEFGGSGVVNSDHIESLSQPIHEQPHSIEITLPPLGVVYLKRKEN